MAEVDSIHNQRLIANGLQHMAYELSLPQPSYFRFAREAHLLLYRSMIESLKGTANLTVTGRLPKNPVFRYQHGDDPWREIHREEVPGCKKTWRFSAPAGTAPPDTNLPRADEPEEHLIGFYDALAMIQTVCFMGQFVRSRPVSVDAEGMATLEWLHESVRNEYEHFVPKYYAASVQELLGASRLCLGLSKQLLLESAHVRVTDDVADQLQRLFAMLACESPSHGAL